MTASIFKVPDRLDPSTRDAIVTRHGGDLGEQRGPIAHERLVAAVAVAQYLHEQSTDVGPHSKGKKNIFSTLLSVAQESVEITASEDSDPLTRQHRAIGRLCSQAVVLHATMEVAATSGNLGNKQARQMKDYLKMQAQEALQAAQDSLIMFSGDDNDKKYAQRIVGRKRRDLKKFEANLLRAEKRHLEKSATKHKKR